MKKVLFAVASLVFGFGTFAQTIVSTEVQKRNAVIEEYTGIGCGYCPLGHQNVQTYAKQHAGRVVAINIHQGGYAQGYYPNFTTQWGNSLAAQCNITGYPAGTLNRAGHTATSLIPNVGPSGTSWYSQANSILNETSPVNIAATASVDASTRVATIHVEMYYTSDVNINENRLNVAVLQNNVEGDQHNYGMYNSDQILSAYGDYSSTYNTRYLHMHMLRDLITGQWGEVVATANEDGVIPAGTYVEKDYTYTLPEYYTDAMYNSKTQVPCTLGDLEFAIFVAEGQSAENTSVKSPNIYTGVSVTPVYTNMEGSNAAVTSISAENIYGCSDQIKNITVKVRNLGGDKLESMTLKYSTTEEPTGKTYDWTGNVATFENTNEILLPETLTATAGKATTVTVEVISINGKTPEASIKGTYSFTKPATPETEGTLTLILKTDKNGNQITWNITNSNGDVVDQGGPYPANQVTRDTVVLYGINTADCYVLELKDSGKDGAGNSGICKLVAPNGTTVTSVKGTWDEGFVTDFKVTAIVGLNEANENIFQSVVYPNPAKDMVTLNVNLGVADNANITVVDLMGRTVVNMGTQSLHSGENQIQINTSNLENGLYYIRVTTDNGMTTNKLNVVK